MSPALAGEFCCLWTFGLFPLLALLDVHLYVFWCHILNIYPIVEMLGHRVHMFSFIDIIRRFPKVIIPNSHRQRMRLPFAPILIRLGYC